MIFIPAIDVLNGKVVRLTEGDYDQVSVYGDDPVLWAQRFEEQGAAWLHLVDLEGARSGVSGIASLVEAVVSKTALHVEVGGGVRSLDTIRALLDAGVSRVVLGTVLVSDPDLAQEAVREYQDFVVAGIDARDGMVKINGWRQGSAVKAEELASLMASYGYQHLIYTDIARDGTSVGIDVEAYLSMAQAFGHPVIASGGVSGIEDIERLRDADDAIEGVIVGRALYEGQISVADGVAACGATIEFSDVDLSKPLTLDELS